MRKQTDLIVAIGIALGGVLGMAGSIVASQNVRALCWAVDGVGLVVATSLLALKFFRKGKDGIAAGFLVWAIGESVMLSGTAASLTGSIPAFAAGTALWSAALLLISLPKEFALWTRAAGIIASVLFAITSIRIFWGEALSPIARPLPFFAYPFLVITFAGWIWATLKED
ncbi:MAG: hypothetical protein ABI158_11075 [Edaphobacter sp.]